MFINCGNAFVNVENIDFVVFEAGCANLYFKSREEPLQCFSDDFEQLVFYLQKNLKVDYDSATESSK